MYVIKRNDGAYVARSGSKHSYTKRLENAQTFKNREAADNNRCVENEYVESIEAAMNVGTYR